MVTEQITNYESRIPNYESCKGSSKKKSFCKHELTWSWDFLQFVHFFLHFVFSFMGDFFMNDPLRRCFLTFPCISPEKRQISNTHFFSYKNHDFWVSLVCSLIFGYFQAENFLIGSQIYNDK